MFNETLLEKLEEELKSKWHLNITRHSVEVPLSDLSIDLRTEIQNFIKTLTDILSKSNEELINLCDSEEEYKNFLETLDKAIDMSIALKVTSCACSYKGGGDIVKELLNTKTYLENIRRLKLYERKSNMQNSDNNII